MSEIFAVGDIIKGIWRVDSVRTGGMGVVYLCSTLTPEEMPASVMIGDPAGINTTHARSKDRDPGKRIAIKCVLSRRIWDSFSASAFEKEALLWAALPPHPHLVRADFVDRFGRSLAIFMEYVAGGDLRQVIAKSKVCLQMALSYGLQFCYAMEFLHQTAAVVHRDIKPENILLSDSGTLKITDLGLASVARKRLDLLTTKQNLPPGDEDIERTGIRGVLGTVPYMSPEQFETPDSVDTRSDVYSFGVVLFEMLSGRRPYDGYTFSALRESHLHAPVPSLQINDSNARPLSDVVRKCLQKRPLERYESFSALKSALSECWHAAGFSAEAMPQPPTAKEVEDNMSVADWTKRGYTLGRLDRFQDSFMAYEKALTLDPAALGVHCNFGTALQRLGRDDEALPYFEEEINRNPNAVFPYFVLAQAYEQHGRLADAVSTQEKGLAKGPDHISGWRHLARLCSRAGDPTGHAAAVNKVRELLHTREYFSVRVWCNEVVMFAQHGDIETARSIGKETVSQFPDDPVGWHDYAMILVKSENREEAVNCLSRALAIDGELTASRVARGILRLQAGNLAEAVSDLQELVVRDPDSVFAKTAKLLLNSLLDAQEPRVVQLMLRMLDRSIFVFL